MAQLLASRTVIQEEAPRVRGIAAVATAITAALGVAERGPVGQANFFTSFDEYTKIHGGHTVNSDLTLGAAGFFENGGGGLWAARTVHYTDPLNPATKTSAQGQYDLNTALTAPSSGYVLGSVVGPFDLEPGDTLVVAINGGAPATATFLATAGARENTSAAPYVLANNQTLLVKVDGEAVAQIVTFLTAEFVDITNATLQEVANVINAKLARAKATLTSGNTRITITSDRRGTTSSIEVTGGTAAAALGFVVGATAGTGNVANIDLVTVAEVKTIVEAAVAGSTVTNVGGRAQISSNTTGPASSVLVQAASTADTSIGFDNATHSGSSGAAVATLRNKGKTDGAYAGNIKIGVSTATSDSAGTATVPTTDEFNLTVYVSGVATEVFPNLTMDSTKARYAPTIVNAPSSSASNLIALTDLAPLGSALQRRPANTVSGPAGPLTGGSDGLVAIGDADFIGASTVNGKTGLRAFDLVQDISLLIVPGRATAGVHDAMITYAEVTREGSMFTILDPPANQRAVDIVDYVTVTASLSERSEFAAIYWPRVKIVNPNPSVFGTSDTIVVPPSGIIAGTYARTDVRSESGVYTPPAGIENGRLNGVVGFETDEALDIEKLNLVYPKRINPITKGKGGPIYLDGTRTLKSSGNFPTIAERRGAINIEQSIKSGVEFARHQNNTPALRKTVERSVTAFLVGEMRKGAFRTTDPKTAFFVDFGDGLNTDVEIFAGRLNGRIGLATNKPIDWIIMSFSQDTRALDAELALG